MDLNPLISMNKISYSEKSLHSRLTELDNQFTLLNQTDIAQNDVRANGLGSILLHRTKSHKSNSAKNVSRLKKISDRNRKETNAHTTEKNLFKSLLIWQKRKL